ncbi:MULTISPECIES: PucR family transcriptional regulator [unclassified Streptomyces]|uniref:PucR family transcriptional regulator n=1 Tax=unclassified Streptomyces TaxID=2593676 RepID=UPI00381F2D74
MTTASLPARPVREDWRALADLCASVRAEVPRLAGGIVDAIREEIPDYHVVPRDEQEAAVGEQFTGLLTGLITRRGPSPEESGHARALGRDRAREGLPLHALIGAFHVGYREIWNVLLTRADARGGDLSRQLVRLVGTVWTWVEQATGAAAEAYNETIRAQEAAQLGLTYRFFEALYTSSPIEVDVARLAHSLGFDPAGTFQAVCAPSAAWADEQLADLRGRVGRRTGNMRCANRGATMVAVVQSMPVDVLIEAMRRHDPELRIGTGLVRSGLAGAAASIVDAQEALALATADGEAVAFGTAWLAATLLPQAGRLMPLLDAAAEPAASHPDLALTVRGFADNGFSLTATGRALHLHPNTVRYRLERWRELTGWDVHTWPGLSASLLGLGLVEAGAFGRADHG